MQSTKRDATLRTATPIQHDQPWNIKLHPKVARIITRYGIPDPAFNPIIVEIFRSIEKNPKLYPAKNRLFVHERIVELRYRGSAWKMIFEIHYDEKSISILDLGPEMLLRNGKETS